MNVNKTLENLQYWKRVAGNTTTYLVADIWRTLRPISVDYAHVFTRSMPFAIASRLSTFRKRSREVGLSDEVHERSTKRRAISEDALLPEHAQVDHKRIFATPIDKRKIQLQRSNGSRLFGSIRTKYQSKMTSPKATNDTAADIFALASIIVPAAANDFSEDELQIDHPDTPTGNSPDELGYDRRTSLEALQFTARQRRKDEILRQEEHKKHTKRKKKKLAAILEKQRKKEAERVFRLAGKDLEDHNRTLDEEFRRISLSTEAFDLDEYASAKPLTKKRYITPLAAEWNLKINTALDVRNESSILAKSMEGVELTRKDIARVIPGEPWLNDEIVNAWYANLCARLNEKDNYIKSPTSIPRWVAYSTAWYKNATEKGVNSIATWSRRKGIKNEKLLQTERIFFPTNTGAHWTLLTISGKHKTIEYLDSLDEYGYAKKTYTNLALAWLSMELGAKFNPSEWTIPKTISASQNNMNDCGVFACLNGWALVKGTKDLKNEFSASEMPLARRMLVATLLNGGFKGDFDL